MKITYLRNSGFIVETAECMLIFDYIAAPNGSVLKDGVLKPKDLNRPNVYVFVSHQHSDHFNPAVFAWREVNPTIKYILFRDAKRLVPKSNQMKFMDEGRQYSDNNLHVRAYGSTDEGISFLVRVDGIDIFHAGDLNLWHWKEESPAEESEMYALIFYNEMEKILDDLHAPVDVAFFPFDPRLGADYYEGALYFADKVKPRYMVPMHFSGNFSLVNQAKEDIEGCGVHFVPLHEYGDVHILDVEEPI
jgi:L-ascorbate metabolism protein UlaG (beta-lactamase superfamily)